MIELLTTPIFSTLAGLLGSYLTRVEERKANRDKYEFELKAKKLDSDIALAQADKAIEQQDLKDRGEAFTETQKASSWMDVGRSIMRPFITCYLLIFCTWLTYMCYKLTGGLQNMDKDFIQSMFEFAVTSALNLNVFAVSWWFGSRPSGSIQLFKGKK
jgi:hypothetical protein